MSQLFLLRLSKLLFICLFSSSLAWAQVPPADLAVNQQVYVQVKTTKLRKDPKQWGAAIADLNYGDSIKTLDIQGDWVKVSNQNGNEGYIHKSAISGRRIILAATAEAILNTSAEETDVFLAGKGFSESVLNRYTGNVAPADLSVMKNKSDISDKKFEEFIQKGKLKDA